MAGNGLKITFNALFMTTLTQTAALAFGGLPSLTYISTTAMIPYLNLGGNSGVTAYELGKDYIIVEFRGKSLYLYNYERPGRVDVENMKKLAVHGQGLNTYINKYVRKKYARKIH